MRGGNIRKRGTAEPLSIAIVLAVIAFIGVALTSYYMTGYRKQYLQIDECFQKIRSEKVNAIIEYAYYNEPAGALHIYVANNGRVPVYVIKIFAVSGNEIIFEANINLELYPGEYREIVIYETIPAESFKIAAYTLPEELYDPDRPIRNLNYAKLIISNVEVVT